MEDKRLAQVVRMDGFITGDMSALKAFRNDPIRSLEEHLETMDEAFQNVAKAGAVGIKSGLAYQRIIEYPEDTASMLQLFPPVLSPNVMKIIVFQLQRNDFRQNLRLFYIVRFSRQNVSSGITVHCVPVFVGQRTEEIATNGFWIALKLRVSHVIPMLRLVPLFILD